MSNGDVLIKQHQCRCFNIVSICS